MEASLFFILVTKHPSMKLLTNFSLVLISLLLVACGGNSTETNSSTNSIDSTTTMQVDSSASLKAVSNNNVPPENITGTYIFGDQESAEGGGYLVIEEQDNDSLKFELDINIGAPNYNSGTATGILKLENNTAVFKTSEYSEKDPCAITFTFNNDHTIELKQEKGSPFSCGFGNRVFANGLYVKQKEEAIFKYKGGLE